MLPTWRLPAPARGPRGKPQLFAETPSLPKEENPHAMASFGDVEWRLPGAPPPPPQALYGDAHAVPWLVDDDER